MTSAWQILGIARDADARTVRSAYARKLKTTRPDDDAAAYQRLREAYDYALERARQAETHSPAAVSETTSVEPAMSVAAVAEAAAPVDPSLSVVDASGPEDGADEAAMQIPDAEQLARSLHQYWQEKGDDALLDAWPSLWAHLDALPLSERTSANIWFAEFVLQAPQMPPAFVLKLADYFEWGRDYRSDFELGPERSEGMAYRLSAARRDERGAGMPPEVAPLARLVELMRSPGRWFALVVLSLLQPGLRQTLDQHCQSMIYLFGKMDVHEGLELSRLLRIAFGVRCAFVAALLFLGSYLAFQDPSADAFDAALGTVFCAGLGVYVLGRVFGGLRVVLQAQFDWFARRMPERFAGLARHRELLALALALSLALLMWLWTPSPYPAAGIDMRDLTQTLILGVGVWSGLLLAWPGGKAGDDMMLFVFSLLAVTIGGALHDTAGAGTGVALALGWISAVLYLLAHHPERTARICFGPRDFSWPRGARAVLVWLLILLGLVFWKLVSIAIAVVLVVLMPFNYLLLEQLRSRDFALGALLIGLIWSPLLFNLDRMPVFGILASAAFAMAALFQLQRVADALAGRMMTWFGGGS